MTVRNGIAIKKQFGQHFLRDQRIVDAMIKRVQISTETSVLEIGCGDGFLTRSILRHPVARLQVFEIDHQWADFVQRTYADPRMTITEHDVLSVDFAQLELHKPWTVLANLPYQITFPILYLFQKNRHLLREGVVMVQEEVAQKIVKKERRGYGFTSLFFQHYFDLELLDKVAPEAFLPPPKVFSRLLYFVPRVDVPIILHEDKFWQFIKVVFAQPRRTLRNNLLSSHYLPHVPEEVLSLRAQQMDMEELLELWHHLVEVVQL